MTAAPQNSKPRQFTVAGTVVCLLAGSLILIAQRLRPSPEIVGSARTATSQFQPLDTKPAPDWGYVGSQVCADCHTDIAVKYQTHPMSRSLANVLDTTVEDSASSTEVRPKNSNRYYCVERSPNSVDHHEFIVTDDRIISDYAVEVHLAIGSGQRGHSYLIDRGNAFFMSPVSWYSDQKRFDLSPGYQPEDHSRFSRRATERCLNCHSGGLRGDAASRELPWRDRFVELAIGCERCHGPGQKHVEYHRADNGRASDDPLLRISQLDASRRDAICNQCHLQGEAEVLRYGRHEGDFRPGMQIGDVWTIFVDRNHAAGESEMAVSQVMQMRSSQCFKNSNGRLSCVSCHDPHSAPSDATRVSWFRSRCLTCHSEHDCLQSATARNVREIDDSCIHCHMPRLDALDVPHVTQTDHHIARAPARRTASATVAPRLSSLQVFDQRECPINATEAARADALMRAEQAILTQNHTLAQEARTALEAIVKVVPSDQQMLESLGGLCELLGDFDRAADFWERYLQIASTSADSPDVLGKLSRLKWVNGDLLSARDGFRRLASHCPWDHQSLLFLSKLLAERGEVEEALNVAKQARLVDRHNVEICLWLAKLNEQIGDLDSAQQLSELARLMK